jgi:hypothetical protein
MNPSTPVIEKHISAIGVTDHRHEFFPDTPIQARGFSADGRFFGHALQNGNSSQS